METSEKAFDLDDVLSLYLTEVSRAWVEGLFRVYREEFISSCARFSKVNITNSGVIIAKYFETKHQVILFPHVVKSVTTILGQANWKMVSIDGTGEVRCKIPIFTIVDYIKQGKALGTRMLEQNVMEITSAWDLGSR